MKSKILTTALLAGFLCTSANAGFEQFNDPIGGMNCFENISGSQGAWLWYSAWGLADVQSITTDNRTFELLPNVNAYVGAVANPLDSERVYWTDSTDGGVTAGPDGNKFMEGLTLFEVGVMTNTSASFSFDVDAYDLDPRYTLVGFIKVLDSVGGSYSVLAIDQVTITGTGSHALSITTGAGMDGQLLQAGWSVTGLNANPADDWGSATVTATALSSDTGDVVAPSPDPMTFASAPVALSDQAISMTATTATDDSGIEYYFTCTAGGGNDSGWQSGTTYVDTGLAASTLYTYTVTARDTSILYNETAASAPASATTVATDTTAPSPDPMTFASVPVAASTLISMTATTATDASSVEYNFVCTLGGGADSGWQSSPTFLATGLDPSTTYAYTVTARDLSAATNVTAASAPALATTGTVLSDMVNSLTGYTGDTWDPATAFDLNGDSLEAGSILDDVVSAISFDGSGATFSDESASYWGRNVLRTLGQDYDDSSFVAYATIVFDGAADQSAFIGLGQGIIVPYVTGNWGVPDLALAGVNSVVCEIKTDTAAGTNACNTMKIQDGVVSSGTYSPAVATIDTFRVKLAYDAGADTATVSLDTGYTGGAFVEDRVLGTIDTSGLGGTNMFYGGPARIFVGGGEGTVVRDLVIEVDTAVTLIDLAAAPVAGGGVVFTWTGVPGQTYEVQYTTDLVSPTWITDPTVGGDIIDAAGTQTATSTVGVPTAFYRFILK